MSVVYWRKVTIAVKRYKAPSRCCSAMKALSHCEQGSKTRKLQNIGEDTLCLEERLKIIPLFIGERKESIPCSYWKLSYHRKKVRISEIAQHLRFREIIFFKSCFPPPAQQIQQQFSRPQLNLMELSCQESNSATETISSMKVIVEGLFNHLVQARKLEKFPAPRSISPRAMLTC